MKLVLFGYGKMGRTIDQLVQNYGYQIINKINSKNIATLDTACIDRKNTVCIDFTTPQAFTENYRLIANSFAQVVVGTTGWIDKQHEILGYFVAKGTTLIHANNFSLGANIYFNIIDQAAKMVSFLNQHDQYDPYILEMHHREKKDHPSGTANTMAKILENHLQRKVELVSLRTGWVKGIHELGFESKIDRITLRHEAYSRDGFAVGALLAAKWSLALKGIWSFQDLLNKKIEDNLKKEQIGL